MRAYFCLWWQHLLFERSVMYKRNAIDQSKMEQNSIAKRFEVTNTFLSHLPVFLSTLFAHIVKMFFCIVIERPALGVPSKRIPQLLALATAKLIYDSLVASVGPGDAANNQQPASDSAHSMNKTFVEINPEIGPGWPRCRHREQGFRGQNYARLLCFFLRKTANMSASRPEK